MLSNFILPISFMFLTCVPPSACLSMPSIVSILMSLIFSGNPLASLKSVVSWMTSSRVFVSALTVAP